MVVYFFATVYTHTRVMKPLLVSVPTDGEDFFSVERNDAAVLSKCTTLAIRFADRRDEPHTCVDPTCGRDACWLLICENKHSQWRLPWCENHVVRDHEKLTTFCVYWTTCYQLVWMYTNQTDDVVFWHDPRPIPCTSLPAPGVSTRINGRIWEAIRSKPPMGAHGGASTKSASKRV